MRKLLFVLLLLSASIRIDVKKDYIYLNRPYIEWRTKLWWNSYWVNTVKFRVFKKYGVIILPNRDEMPDFTNPW